MEELYRSLDICWMRAGGLAVWDKDMSINLVLAVAMTLTPLATAPAAQADSGCKITSPSEGWPGGGVPGYNTRLHSGHNNDWANQVRPIGNVKAIMLFIDFPNAIAPDSTQVHYDFLVPKSTEFFRTASYGKFNLTVDAPQKWYRMSKPDTEYGMGYIISPEVQAVYIQEAIRLAESDVDFTQYTHVYVVPPRNARGVPYSPEWNDYRGVVTGDGKVFKNGVTFGQDAWYWGWGILNHETGHDMGLPEDYNATGVGAVHGFVGGWDLMGNIHGHAPDYFAWEKWKMGWLEDRQVHCVNHVGAALLRPIETPGGTKALVVRTGRYTAWVAEVRSQTGPCPSGVLVYKVDVSLPNGAGNIRVHDGHPEGTGCANQDGRLDKLNDAVIDGSFEADGVRVEVLTKVGDAYIVLARQSVNRV